MLKQRILEGYSKFRNDVYPGLKRLYRDLATEGQSPSTLIISCADSRVEPGRLFSANPGEIFIARNVANIVPPYRPDPGYQSIGAVVEFAVLGLGVDTIMVLGHGKCGGIQALLDGTDGDTGTMGYVHNWMELAEEARKKILAEMADEPRDKQLLALEEENVRLGLKNLMTYPWIKERVEAGKLELVGGHFSIEHGVLYVCTLEDGTFRPVGEGDDA
jgi:carbonic anhydrase